MRHRPRKNARVKAATASPRFLKSGYTAVIRKRLFNLLAAFSLLICLLTIAVWIRSYWQSDVMAADRSRSWDLSLNRGRFSFSVETLYPASVTIPGYRFHRTGPAEPFSDKWEFYHASAPPRASVGIPTLLGFGRTKVFSVSVAVAMTANQLTPATGPAQMGNVAEGFQWNFPAWFVCALAALMPGLWIWKARMRSKTVQRLENNFCEKCGYDLRATLDRCPECGTLPTKAIA